MFIVTPVDANEVNGGDMKINGLQKQAASGDASAMVQLGEAYRLGQGVAANMALALDWYERAADAGSIDGMYLASFLNRQRRNPEAYHRAVDHMVRALDVCKTAPDGYYCTSPHLWLELSYAQAGLSRLND